MTNTPRSLLERLRDPGDRQAWQRLVTVYEPWLRGWLSHTPLQAADCDDVLQAVFAVVNDKRLEFVHNGRPGAFRTWLRSILNRQVRQFLRQERRWQGVTVPQVLTEWLEQMADPNSELSRRWDQEHDQQLVRRMLLSIQPEFNATTWQVFQMLVFEELPVQEVAQRLGITANAVYVAKARVMSRLREEVRGLVDE